MDIFFFIFMWVIAGGLVMKDYVKLSKKEKAEGLQQLKQPAFLFSDGVRTLGLMLFCSGMIRTFAFLKPIGIVLLFVGMLTTGAMMWGASKKRSLLIIFIALLFFFIFLNELLTWLL